MSVESVGAGGRIMRITTGLPASTAPIAMCGWVQIKALRAGFWEYFCGFEATSEWFLVGLTGASNRKKRIHLATTHGGLSLPETFDTPTNRWMFWATTQNTPDNTVNAWFWLRHLGRRQWIRGSWHDGTVASWRRSAVFVPTQFSIGNDSWNEYGYWRNYNVKVWTAYRPGDGDLYRESFSFDPVRKKDLWGWWQLKQAGDLADYSGNGNTLTETGTPGTMVTGPNPKGIVSRSRYIEIPEDTNRYYYAWRRGKGA